MLDEVCVDYEIRCLHSLMHYTQSSSRISQASSFGLGKTPGYLIETMIECVVRPSESRFFMRKYEAENRLKTDHYLERGFKFSGSFEESFRFRANGESVQSNATIDLSKGAIKRSLVLTNYGRIRIDR